MFNLSQTIRFSFRKYNRMKIMTLVFLMFQVIQLHAQAPSSQYTYIQVGVNQGLSNPAARQVFRDSFGYLWVVTFDGLNRWDGYSMKVYRQDKNDPHSLSVNGIREISEDKSRDLLIVGYDGVIARYNRSQDNFTSIITKPTSTTSSHSLHITPDYNSGYWITNDRGIHHKNFSTNQELIFDLKDSTKNGYKMLNIKILKVLKDSAVYAFGYPGYCRYNGLGKFEHILLSMKAKDTIEHYLKNNISDMACSTDGTFWLTTAYGLCHFDPKTKKAEWYKVPLVVPENILKTEFYAQDLRSICIDKDGIIWIGSWQGLFRYDSRTKQFTAFMNSASTESIPSNTIYSVFADTQGIIWGGTWGGGVFGLVAGRSFATYRQTSDPRLGPKGNNIFSFWEDRDSNLYVGAYAHGISYFNRKTSTFSDLNFPVESVWRIDTAKNGDLLFLSENRGVFKRTSSSFKRIGAPKILDNAHQALANDVFGEYSYNSKNETIQKYNIIPNFEKVIGEYSTIGIDQLHQWVFSKKSGIVLYNMVTDEHIAFDYNKIDSSELLSSEILFKGKEPNIIWWVCGMDFIQLVRFNTSTGKYTLLKTKISRQKFSMRNVVLDKQNTIWLSTNNGLIRINSDNGNHRIYTKADGLPSSYFNHNGAALCGKSGRLYFGTSEGYVEFYPDSLHDNSYKPTVVFTAFRRDTKDISLDSSISAKHHIFLAYNENRFSLEFAALNFISPQKNQYMYRLEGYDHEWIASNSRREAFYTNLSPGTYIFHVRGSNNDGVWNDNEAQVVITISPPWWQTMWAYMSYSFVFVTGFVVLRNADIKRRQQKLIEAQRARENAIIKEKNVLLEIERAKSESLLLNILPASIAERLKAGERNIADHYDAVTILFADIVGFTPLTQTKQPRQIVEMLNNLFSRFDRATELHGAERIKTIGDAYMVVAGAPTPCDDHALRIAKLAFAMLEQTALFCEEIGENIQLRIGINTGEAIGAVIGETKFIYDLWSDAVNTASRMESHGEAGKIHCTEEFKHAVETVHAPSLQLHAPSLQLHAPSLQFIRRGEMEIKGKGIMNTYFLEKAEK